ncbi:Ig-like V-type domain-containing protein FAM187A [Embiotoca jacksoni]|uniref:Ig-like V-type domain-containing protein FAM187A n=1 Tax=Embiotoca jacksoni TaxID=100190 RepID=UPI0037038B43
MELRSYEAEEDKEDVFSRRACPAFLTFSNAAFLAGVTVELPCHCKQHQVQSVVWFFRKHLGRSEETQALTDHHGNKLLDTSEVSHNNDLRSRFSIRLFSLLIFRAGTSDSGVYICGSARRDFFYGHDLDIQEARTISFAPRLAPENMMRKREQNKTLGASQPLYRVFTSFQSWSVCDRCGTPGEQVRVGLCYVHSRFLHVRYRRSNQTVASCGSGAVPRAFGQLKQSGAGARLEVKSCQMPCSSEAVLSSKIQSLMAFLGYRPASLPDKIKVSYLTHPVDTVLTMGCPGARPDMAVGWDRQSKPIYRREHLAGGNLSVATPRLTIDVGHHLVFQPAKLEDSGTYFCWLQGRRAFQIQLLVYAHLGRGHSVMSHPDFPIAVKMVLNTYAGMTFLFCLLLLGRARWRHLRDSQEIHHE